MKKNLKFPKQNITLNGLATHELTSQKNEQQHNPNRQLNIINALILFVPHRRHLQCSAAEPLAVMCSKLE